MALASNILQDARYVQVISFDPPTEGGSHGTLYVRCTSEDEYQGIRRFLDEDHGSALKGMDGGVWYIHRLNDDADLRGRFPQHVRFRVEWRFRT